MSIVVSSMESTKPLAIDSFSYSWLSNVRTSFDGLDEPLRPSFDGSETYPEKSQNFNFNVSLSQSSPTLLHADELFADGIIKPFFAGKSEDRNFQISSSLKTCPTPSLYSFAQKTIFPAIGIHCPAPARLRKSSVQTLRRCIAYLTPSCFKSGCRRKSTKVDVDRRFQELGSWNCSPQPSQPQSSASAYVTGDWNDAEGSIREAILHCKREWKLNYMMETGKRVQKFQNAKRSSSKAFSVLNLGVFFLLWFFARILL